MLLKLDGIKVHCILGDRPEERTTPQEVRIDLVLELPPGAAEIDRLEGTIDYVAVKDKACAIAIDAKAQMMEHLAKLVFDGLKPACRCVRITKRGTMAGLESASVEYP